MMIDWYHQRFIHHRRVDVLAGHFCDLISPGASVLDVGCGDGQLSAKIADQRPDLMIQGIDVLVRQDAAIAVERFDGSTLPQRDRSVDAVIMVDVLHHTQSPLQLLREAARVTRKQVIVKDHFLQGFAAYRTLAMMDHVGNARHGVQIPCNYLKPQQWRDLYAAARLEVVQLRSKLGLYPPPLRWFFERQLHFVAALEPLS